MDVVTNLESYQKQLPSAPYTYQSKSSIITTELDELIKMMILKANSRWGHDVPTKQHQELDYEIESVELLHKVTTDENT